MSTLSLNSRKSLIYFFISSLNKLSLSRELFSITNRIKDLEERISGVEDNIEEIDTTVNENSKHENILTQNIQETQDTMKRQNLGIIGREETEESQLQWPANILNKLIEENFPKLNKEMPISMQEMRKKKQTDETTNEIPLLTIKEPSSIQRQTYQNYTRILNRNTKSQKSLDRGHVHSKKTEMPAHATISSKTLNQHT